MFCIDFNGRCEQVRRLAREPRKSNGSIPAWRDDRQPDSVDHVAQQAHGDRATSQGSLRFRPGSCGTRHADLQNGVAHIVRNEQRAGVVGIGGTLIPEMAVAVETRSASVSVARFKIRNPRELLA